VLFFSSVRVFARSSAHFSRDTPDGVQSVDGHFSSHRQIVSAGHKFDLNQLLCDFLGCIEQFNSRGSGFVLDLIFQFTLVVTKFRPLAGLSYIPTPANIVKKRALINVQNGDNRCFEWAVLSALYPPESRHVERVSSYVDHQGTLNFQGISFPVQLRDLPKFETQNPEISVNVISPDPENNGYTIDYVSPHRQRPHHVNLLLLHNTDTQHYVWIKDFSRLLGDRTHHPSFVCNGCLNVFSSQHVLDNHIILCSQHKAQQVVYPEGDDGKLKFKDHDKEHPHKFFLVCNFESFLVPSDKQSDPDAKTRIIDEHEVSGYCCYRVTDLEDYQTDPVVYRGPNVMNHFYEHVMSESREINKILSQRQPLSPMSPDQVRQHKAATECANCRLNSRIRTTKSLITITSRASTFLLPVTTVTFNSSLKKARPLLMMRTQTVTP